MIPAGSPPPRRWARQRWTFQTRCSMTPQLLHGPGGVADCPNIAHLPAPDCTGRTPRASLCDRIQPVRPGLVAVCAVFSVAIWILALVGLVRVATTSASPPNPEPERPASLLSPEATSNLLRGFEVPGLDHVGGFELTAYRQISRAGQLITEVEYAGAASVDEVREFYQSLFEEYGWTFTEEWAHGPKSMYSVLAGDRHGTLEIDRIASATEVTIELSEPTLRGGSTDR